MKIKKIVSSKFETKLEEEKIVIRNIINAECGINYSNKQNMVVMAIWSMVVM